MASAQTETRSRQEEYYMDDGNVVLCVGDKLFKLHRSILSRNSNVFRTTLSLPQAPGTTEGTTDDEPIFISDCDPRDFERLLGLIYSSPESSGSQSRTLDDWKAILEMARRFQVDWVHERAFQEMNRFPLDPVDKIEIAHRFENKRSWVRDAYVLLVRRQTPLSIDEARRVELLDSVRLFTAREYFRDAMSHAVSTTTVMNTSGSSSRLSYFRRNSAGTARQNAAPYPNPHSAAAGGSNWASGSMQTSQQPSLAHGLVAAGLGPLVAPVPPSSWNLSASQQQSAPSVPSWLLQQQQAQQMQMQAIQQAQQQHHHQQPSQQMSMHHTNPAMLYQQQSSVAAGLAGPLSLMMPGVMSQTPLSINSDADEQALAERIVDAVFEFKPSETPSSPLAW